MTTEEIDSIIGKNYRINLEQTFVKVLDILEPIMNKLSDNWFEFTVIWCGIPYYFKIKYHSFNYVRLQFFNMSDNKWYDFVGTPYSISVIKDLVYHAIGCCLLKRDFTKEESQLIKLIKLEYDNRTKELKYSIIFRIYIRPN